MALSTEVASKLTLSTEEAKLYDRQLRLWGVEGQQRLSTCNVLVLGLSLTNLEAAKCLVLAGIRISLSAATNDQLEISAKNLQALNAFTSVTVIRTDIMDIDFTKFTDVIADSTQAIEQLVNILENVSGKIGIYMSIEYGADKGGFLAPRKSIKKLININPHLLPSGFALRRKLPPNESLMSFFKYIQEGISGEVTGGLCIAGSAILGSLLAQELQRRHCATKNEECLNVFICNFGQICEILSFAVDEPN